MTPPPRTGPQIVGEETRARRTVGVLLAGGTGTRTGLDYPKQFLRIGGRTVLEHTLSVFEEAGCIDEVIIMIAEPWIATARSIVESCGAGKVTAIIPGGSTRNETTRAAITHLTTAGNLSDAKLLIHDAVRPLVTRTILSECAEALDCYDAVDVVVPPDDTIVEVHDNLVTRIPPREHLRRGQTPQAFSLRVLRAAYAALEGSDMSLFTDDCAVVMAAFPELPILALPGAGENMKITRPIDIYLADRLLQLRRGELTVSEADRVPGAIVVIGGSSGIGAATVELLRSRGWDAVSLSRREGGVDVRDESSIRAALTAIRKTHGRVAGVVNSAGLLTTGDLVELTTEQIDEEIDVNFRGSVNVARVAHEFLKETGGHLVLFTSSSYTRGRGGYAVYSATKAAIVNLTQALSEEWHADGVKISAINPARTNTPMRTRAFGPEEADTLLDASTVADTVASVLLSTASGHVYDVRVENAPAPAARPATAA